MIKTKHINWWWWWSILNNDCNGDDDDDEGDCDSDWSKVMVMIIIADCIDWLIMMNILLQQHEEEEEGHLHRLYYRKRTYTSERRSVMSYDDDANMTADQNDVTTIQVWLMTSTMWNIV